MDLRHVGGLFRDSWDKQPLDSWASQLQSVCGRYNPVPEPGRRLVLGEVRALNAGGVDFAHVTKDLSSVTRSYQDLRRDESEHIFLIIQLSGNCVVRQSDRQALLGEGDCVLVDSTKPSLFGFSGKFSNQLSVHLPRQTMYSEKSVRFDTATTLSRSDPMALTLRGIVAKMLSLQRCGVATSHFESLLYDATRLAFVMRGRPLAACVDGPAQRLEIYAETIDLELTDPKLRPSFLADTLGVPLRTLQDDFQSIGTTCTAFIRDKRLKLAAELLSRKRGLRDGPSIAETAFASGFSDISYFNKSFRELHGVAPTDYVRGGERRRPNR